MTKGAGQFLWAYCQKGCAYGVRFMATQELPTLRRQHLIISCPQNPKELWGMPKTHQPDSPYVIPDADGTVEAAYLFGGLDAARVAGRSMWSKAQAKAWRTALHVARTQVHGPRPSSKRR